MSWKSLFMKALRMGSRRRQARADLRRARQTHFCPRFDELETRDNPGAFTVGNLVVERMGDGTAALSSAATKLFLDEFTTGGTPVQAGASGIALPTADSGTTHAMTDSGVATSAGLLLRSADGHYLTLVGYDATPGASGVVASRVARVIGRVDNSATIDSSTLITDGYGGANSGAATAGNNIRGAATVDGTAFWTSGASGTGATDGGVRYATLGSAGTSTQIATNVTNTRSLSIFNNQLYADASTSTGPLFGPGTVGTGLPTTSGQTITQLNGFPTASGPSAYQFVFKDANTIYVADDRTTAGGGIEKWTQSGGTWSMAYSALAGTVGLRGLTLGADGTLYGTTGETTANRLVSITDTGSGFNFTTLATAPTNEIFRGVAFTPTPSTAFTPGNLLVLQEGDGTNTYTNTAPLFLNQITTGGTSVSQTAIPNTQTVGGPGNQPITIDQTAAAGNGQLTRSYDGSVLVFGGLDSGINSTTATGSADRVLAVAGNDPSASNFLNTTTHGQFYVGDDNRGGVAESATGPIWSAGHPNQAGGAVSQGVHYFATEGPSIGTQVSATTNVRGITIGFDNRVYLSTAAGLGGAAALNTAGIFTSSQAALPTDANANPANDVQVVPALFTASKLGGIYLADVNADGVIDNGDRLYFNDDGTVGGVGTGGLYVATWNDSITANAWNTPNNAAAVAAGLTNHWSVPVRLGDAPAQDSGVGNLRGLTGTVISPTEVDLYTTAFDNKPGHTSFLQKWVDTNTGVAIADAKILSGTTVQITTLTPNAFTNGQTVVVDGVGGTGPSAITGGYNGSWVITVVDSTHFTYTDTNSGASSLAEVTNQGAADVALTATTVTSLATGTNGAVAAVGLRGVAFAPVAPTSVSLSQSPANPLTPGTPVTLTATLINAQITNLSGQVAFIDNNTNTVLGFGTISGNQASLTTTLVGNHFVSAYFAGGGTLALASARSNVIQVFEAGATASTTNVVSNLSAAAVGRQVTLTATVTSGATGTLSFYNGSVSLANLLGTSALSGTTATLNTVFGTAGTQTIVAVYNGDNTFASSQGTTSVNVAANATVAVTPSAGGVAKVSTQTYTATITGNATLGTPAGTVVFTIRSATTNSSGAPVVSATSAAITLTPGPNNTATALWTGPALSAAGSYFVTVSYTATGSTNPYSAFATNTTSSANGVALIETVKQAFTPGNLVAVRRGDGTVNLGSNGYLVMLDEYTPAGALVQSIALPNADSGSTHGLLLSGQDPDEGLINRSADGYTLSLFGYDINVGHTFVTSTFPFQFGRTIASIDGSAGVNTSTVISTSPSSSVPYVPLDVVSADGKEFWILSSLNTGNTTESGVEYVASLGATTATQIGPAAEAGQAIGIAGGQLYVGHNGDTHPLGTGLPTTAGQTLGELPNLATAYASAGFGTTIQSKQFLFLNTADGSSNNPNLLYVADQANGLLKFWKDTSGNWQYGGPGGTFGQKLLFSGGITGVVGFINNPGTASASVQLYVTGSSIQGANPNQVASFLDTHGAPAGTAGTGVDQGFPSGNFARVSFVGGSNAASPNGNENFAGLAFVPGYASSTTLAESFNSGTNTYTFNVTVTDAHQGAPTGVIYYYVDGSSTPSGTVTLTAGTFSSTATFNISGTVLGAGSHTVRAAYQGSVLDGTSTGTVSFTDPPFGANSVIASTVNTSTGATSITEWNNSTASQTSPIQTINLPTSGAGTLTEGGTFSNEGYVTLSTDGHTASVVGYASAAGSSTTGANATIGVVNPNGSVETSTQIANADTTIGTSNSVKATASADGLGFWVASNNYIRYVPFGNTALTPTTAVSNFFTGQPFQSTQSPNAVEIWNGQLYGDAGAAAQSNGVPANDGPFTVGSGLPTTGGNTATNLQGFPTTSDPTNGFPQSRQFAVSPDGLFILVSDSRTNAGGGLLAYFDTLGSGAFTNVTPGGGVGFPIPASGSTAGTPGADTGLRGLSVDWTGFTPGGLSTIHAWGTTSAASGNRLVRIDVTIDETTGAVSYNVTTLSTAAAGTAFRGASIAPQAPGATTSTTTLTVSGSPGTYPSGVTLSATVTGGSGTPTGYVSFRTAAGVEIGSARLVGGTATLTPSADFFAGTYTGLVAVYTGNATYAPSTSAGQSATVNKDSTTTTLTAQPPAVATGVADTLTATISAPLGTAPTGTVEFWDGPVGTGTNLGTGAVVQKISGGVISFQASISTTFATTGAHSLHAVYSGDSNFATSTGDLTVNVVLPSTTVVTTSNANPTASPSQNVTLTATVSGTGGPATGTVQFYDNLLPIGSPVALSGGTASVTVSTSLLQQAGVTLLPGLQSITAIYSGDTTYFTSGGVFEQAVQAQSFGTGDQLVERVGDGTTGLIAPTGNPNAGSAPIGSTIYLDEYSPAGTLIQSIILPTADGQGTQAAIHAIVGNGQQSATGQMTLSGDGRFVFLTGYDNNPLSGADATGAGIGTTAAAIPTGPGGANVTRSVARVDASGVVQVVAMTAANSGSGFGNFNGVYSPDGNQFYVTGGASTGSSEVIYYSSFTPSAGLQTPTASETSPTGGTGLGLESMGGNLALVQSGTGGPILAYPNFPTSAASASAPAGITSAAATAGGQASTFYIDAYFTHENGTGAPAGINTMYLSDDGVSFAHGVITKWALVSGTWQVVAHITAGTGNTGTSFYWISGVTDASGNVTLFVTYGNGGNGGTGGGELDVITDTSGYNGTGMTFANAGAPIATAATGSKKVFRGAAAIPLSATTTTLTDNGPNPSTVGQAVGFTVTVTGGSSISGETVNVEDADAGNAVVATPTLTGGTVTFNITTLTAGTHHLFAVYPGDATHAASQSSQVLQTVNNGALNTATTLVDNGPNPSFFGQSVSFTATVVNNPAGGVTPTGTVQLEDASNGNALVGSAQTLVGGTVTFSVPLPLTLGTHNLFVVYSGDSGTNPHNPSQSTTVAQNITAIPTSVLVTSDQANPTAASGTTINFTATVTAVDASSVAGGTVQFFNGTLAVGSPITLTATGVATTALQTSLLQGAGKIVGGINSIRAVFTAAAASNQANSAGVLNQRVQAQAFGATDQLIERVGDGTSAVNVTTGSQVFVDEFLPGTAGQAAPVQTLSFPTSDDPVFAISTATESSTTVTITTATNHNILPGQNVTISGVSVPGYNGTFVVTGVTANTIQYAAAAGLTGGTGGTAQGTKHALVQQGQQSGTGELSQAGDNQYLFLTGYDVTPPGSGDVRGTGFLRTIGRVKFDGTVETGVTLSDTTLSGTNNINGVYSPDGDSFYVGSASFGAGIRFVAHYVAQAGPQTSQVIATGVAATGATSVTSTNMMGLGVFDNTLFVSSTTGATLKIGLVGTAGTLPTPSTPVSVTAATNSGATTAILTVPAASIGSFAAGQLIQVAGITGAGYNGQFVIQSVDTVADTITYTTAGLTGAGTVSASSTVTQITNITPLPGVTLGTGNVPKFPIGFFMADLSPTVGFAGTAMDTLYIGEDGSAFNNGTLTKWTFDGTNWNLTSTINAAPVTGPPLSGTPGFYWVSGTQSGTTVNLFTTYSEGGGTIPNGIFGQLYGVQDTGGYNNPFSTTTLTVLSTANGTSNVGVVYHGAASVPVQTLATTTTLTSNPASPVAQGTSVTFTATVVGNPATGFSPTGTVTFLDGTTTLGTGTLNANGVATFTTTSLTVGSHTINANYGGATGWGTSTANIPFTVTSAGISTTTALTPLGVRVSTSPDVFAPATAGGSIEQGYGIGFLVSVTPSSAGPATGSVQLFDGATPVGPSTALTNGSATIVLTGLSVATHSLTAQYTPTGSFLASTTPTAFNQVVDANLKVNTTTAGLNGFTLQFNAPLNPARLNMYSPSALGGNANLGIDPSLPVQSGTRNNTTGLVTLNVTNLSTILTSSGRLVVTGVGDGYDGVYNQFTITGGGNTVTYTNGKTGTFATTVGAGGQAGPALAGSAEVWNDTFHKTTAITFIPTGSWVGGVPVAGALPTGTNHVFVGGGNTPFAIQDTLGDSLPADFEVTATVTASTAPTVSAPYFARGWTQAVNLPLNSSAGLPIAIQNPAGATNTVTGGTFTFTYDPAFLTIPLGSAAGTFAGGVTGTITGNGVGPDGLGSVSVTISGGLSLAPGANPLTVLNLNATVPNNAPYGGKELLDFRNIDLTANSGATHLGGNPGTAVHVAALPGDTQNRVSAPGVVNGSDAAFLNQVSSGNAKGYADYPNLDPKVLSDVDNSSVINGTDGAFTNQEASTPNGTVNPNTPTIPAKPTFTPIPPSGGPDPRLYIPDVQAVVGQTKTVQVRMQVTEAGGLTWNSDDVGFRFDPTKFAISNVRSGIYPGIANGTDPQIGTSATIDNNLGTLRVSQFFSGSGNFPVLPNGADGPVLLFDITVLAGAQSGSTPVTTSLNLAHDANGGLTDVNGGAATLSPAPTNNPGDTNVDGTLTILPTSGSLAFQNPVVPIGNPTPGSTITVPVIMTVGTGGFAYNSDDLGIRFDPTVVNVVSVSSGIYPGIANGTDPQIGTSATIDNNLGTLRVSQFFSGSGNFPVLPENTTGTVLNIVFQILPGVAPSTTTVLNMAHDANGGLTDINGGAVTLIPAPTNGTTDAVDGVLTVTILVNQPPRNVVPTTLNPVLFNPAAAAGLQTATPNTLVFSAAAGDPIQVNDPNTNSGVTDTTVITLTGTGSSAPVGTLTVPGGSGVTVTFNAAHTQATLTGGTAAQITAALDGMAYLPGPGFFGTAHFDVLTTNNNPGGFPTSVSDDRSTSVQVVGLFISEVDLLKGNVTNPSQYVEVFSTVPNFTIPSGIFLVGINGAAGTPAPGLVTDIFNLAGFTTGTNGYLALLEKGEKYLAGGFEVAAGTEFDNIGTGVGFGNGGATSKFGTITGVHTGGTRPTGQLATDMLAGAESFLLIQAATAPTTATNIDPANTGNPTNQTTAYTNWNVLDSVGILNTTATSHSYAATTFKPTGGGSTLTGSTVISTGFTANFVGRIAKNTGQSNTDWLASLVTGTPATGAFTLGAGANSTQFGGQSLNSVGGPNFWAPQMTVVVNDGSDLQHSQVSELTLSFNEPVNIVDLVADFVVKDATGHVLSITVTDPNTGVTTAGATGPVPDTGATVLIITFTSGSIGTFNFINPDPFGNTVGLLDGNYFLNTLVADVTNSGVALDGAHTGVAGSTADGTHEIDEFWRLYGDVNGDRQVDGLDNNVFRGTFGSTSVSPNYLWFLDVDEDGNINTTDLNAFRANRGKRLDP
jgi:hypothetical protein